VIRGERVFLLLIEAAETPAIDKNERCVEKKHNWGYNILTNPVGPGGSALETRFKEVHQ